MKKRDVLNSPRLLGLRRQRQRIVLFKIFLSLTALALVFGGLVYISRIPGLNISSIEITGNKFVETPEIRAVAEKELFGKYLWVFPKTNILLYPKSGIEKELRKEIKRLKDINISLKNTKTLEIAVTERGASYVWCGNTPPEGESEEKLKCNFLDSSGYMFDESPYFSGEVYFKFYGADLSQVNFDKLISFKKTSEVMGLKPVAFFIRENKNIKMLLSPANPYSTKPEVIFKADADLETIAENLQVTLSTEPMKSNFKNKYASLEYIDLRFGNKVYFKFR